MRALHILISGRVQGVGFRWFVEQQAVDLGVSGYVRNLPDGRVEVLAQADEGAMERFCGALRRGPALSRTDELVKKPVPIDPGLQAFHIRF